MGAEYQWGDDGGPGPEHIVRKGPGRHTLEPLGSERLEGGPGNGVLHLHALTDEACRTRTRGGAHDECVTVDDRQMRDPRAQKCTRALGDEGERLVDVRDAAQ